MSHEQQEQEVLGRRAFIGRGSKLAAGVLFSSLLPNHVEAATSYFNEASLPLERFSLNSNYDLVCQCSSSPEEPEAQLLARYQQLTHFAGYLFAREPSFRPEISSSELPPSWDQIMELATELETLSQDAELVEDWSVVRADISRARLNLEPRAQYLDRLIEIDRQDGRLFDYFRKLSGNGDHLVPDQWSIPFTSEKIINDKTKVAIFNFLSTLQLLTPVGNQYLSERGVSQGSINRTQEEVRSRLRATASEIRGFLVKESKAKEWFQGLEITTGAVSIIPASDKPLDEVARQAFERDRLIIERVLDHLPHYQYLRTVIMLDSLQYGEGVLPASKAERFETLRIPGSNKFYVQVTIDVDRARQDTSLEMVAAHGLGHGVDPLLINRALADHLAPEQLYLLLLTQQENINDRPYWLIADQNIDQIFDFPETYQLAHTSQPERLTVEVLRRRIRERAMNLILQNGLEVDGQGVLVSLYNHISEERGATKILLPDVNKRYETSAQFYAEYLPRLEAYLNDSSRSKNVKVREQLIWLALQKFGPQLANTSFLWELNSGLIPRQDKSALAYLSYLDFVATGAYLLHCAINQDTEGLELLNRFQLDKLYRRVTSLRGLARKEFSADTAAYYTLYQGKVDEEWGVPYNVVTNPHHQFLGTVYQALRQQDVVIKT